MKARATTTVTILRGSGVDSFGDERDTAATVREGVTASIIEQNKTVTTPVDGTPRVVRHTTCRLPAGTDVRTGDRLRDERTGAVYIVDAEGLSQNPVRRNDIRLDLRRVT